MNIAVLYCGSGHIKTLIDRSAASKVNPFVMPSDTPVELISQINPKGIIISGSPLSVLNPDGPLVDKGIYDMGIPVLGICYGIQRMAMDLGGEVVRLPVQEKGAVLMEVYEDAFSELYQGFTIAGIDVWMAHSCQVAKMPDGFVRTGSTKKTQIASMERGNLFGVQFHPEKAESGSGKQIMNNFFKICAAQEEV